MTDLLTSTHQATRTTDSAPPSGGLAIPADVQDLLFRDARTANAFTDEEIAPEQLRAVHELIKWGPTAMNTQPLRVVLLPRGSGRDRLVPLLSEGNRAKTAAAPLTAILAADLHFHAELPQVFPANGQRLADTLGDSPEQRRDIALLSVGLQIGYFIVGVRAAGLAAGPMSGFDAEAVSAEFFDDGEHLARVIVNLGHPAGDAYRPRNPRLSFDEVHSVA